MCRPVVHFTENMASPLPDIPYILYCGIRESSKELTSQLFRSETIEAALTRLITTTGTIHAVDYKDHITNRQYYVIKLECTWPKEKAKSILDPKSGSTSLRNDGYDVAIRTRENGGHSFVILNPHEVVYQISYQSPTTSPVVIATRASAHCRRRLQGDPREPQEEVDSLVFKLNLPFNPLDDFPVEKIAKSYDRELVWAKEQVVAVLRRVTRGRGDCWRYVLVKDQSPNELQLRLLFMSFGRKCPEPGSGLKAMHLLSNNEGSNAGTCIRPSHLCLISTLDSTTLKRTVHDLSALLGQMHT